MAGTGAEPNRDAIAAIEEAARQVFRQQGPALVIVTKWANEWFSGNDLVFAIHAFRRHVGVEFWRGAALAPGHLMLEGTGKNLRHVKLRAVAEATSPAFAALVRAAVRLDAVSEKRPR